MSYLQDIIEKQMKSLVDKKENDLMGFLKSKGYKPKRTEKYIKGLQYRLKRKGLRLVCYNETPPMFKDNTLTTTYWFKIEHIKEEKDEI